MVESSTFQPGAGTEEGAVSPVKQKRTVRFASAAAAGGGGGDLESLLPPVLEDVYEIPHIKDLTEDEIFEIWLQPVDYFTIYVDYSTLVDQYVAQEDAFKGGNTKAGSMGCGKRRSSSTGCCIIRPRHLFHGSGGGGPIARFKRHYYIHFTRPKYLAKQDNTEDDDDEDDASISASDCCRNDIIGNDGGNDCRDDEGENDILRGLEDLVPSVAHEKEAIIKKSIQAVLAEQELQRSVDIDTEEGDVTTNSRTLNPDSIARAYLESIGSYVTRRAREVALEDASHANRIYKDGVDEHNSGEHVEDSVEVDVLNSENSTLGGGH